MAIRYGTNANNRDNTIPPVKVPGYDQGGRSKIFYDEILLTSDLAVGDVINLARLPKAVRIASAVIVTDALGGSCAGTLGFSASNDGAQAAQPAGLIAAPALAAAGRSNSAAEAGMGLLLAGEVTVQLTITAVSSGAAGKKIRVWVHGAQLT